MIGRGVDGARYELPIGRDEGRVVLPCIFALIAYVAVLAGVGLLTTDAARRGAEQSIADRLTVTIPAEASEARRQTIVALLRQTAGVAEVHLLTPTETAALLTPWLGPTAPLDELPVPRLVDVRIASGATIDFATLRKQLASVTPEARLDDHRAWLDAQLAAAWRLSLLFLGGIVLSAGLVAATAAFATRAALTIGGSRIELLHLLGATDRAIAYPFALGMLARALPGAAIGGIAAVGTVGAFGAEGIFRLPAPFAAVGFLDWRSWAIATLVALAIGAIAMASAGLLVLRRLARMP